MFILLPSCRTKFDSTIIFVTCCSVLLFMFVPKMKFLTKQLNMTKSQRQIDAVHISGLEPPSSSMRAGMGDSNRRSQAHGSVKTTKVEQPEITASTGQVATISGLSCLSGASTTSGNSSEEGGIRFTLQSHDELEGENKQLRRRLNLRNVSLGTLATDSSVSGDSGGSSGMKILSRKSPTELMTENKKLKKLLKKNVNKIGSPATATMYHQSIDDEAKESEKEDLEQGGDCYPQDAESPGIVSNLERGEQKDHRRVSFQDLATEPLVSVGENDDEDEDNEPDLSPPQHDIFAESESTKTTTTEEKSVDS